MFEFSRIEVGVIHYNTCRVDLEECLEECESLMAPQIRAQGLTYSRDPVCSPIALSADAEKLRQIVLNLLGNAIKYNLPNGHIGVAIDTDDRCAYILVSDTGRGISPDQLDLIFQPFVQLTSGGSIREGVGLGLPISRSLARGMGGELKAETNPAGGSTFVLSLPLADD